jgi:ParB-like chromosome segregation protein Spo0J
MGRAKIPAVRNDLVDGPIIVTSKGMVVNGHARPAVAREYGVDELRAIAVTQPDIPTRQREEC